MERSKVDDSILVYSPFQIRPGTSCTVEVTCYSSITISWDSSTTLNETISGFVVSESVKSTVDIPVENITISYVDDDSVVTIDPINNGVIDLDIYFYVKTTNTVISESAFNSLSTTYYKDYILIDNVVIPKTIIPFAIDSNAVAVKVTPDADNNGVDYFGDVKLTINSEGLLESEDFKLYILKTGRECVRVPMDFDGPYIMIENGMKVIEIDNQEWISGYNEARGLLVYGNNIIVTTNKSLCVFDIYSDFSEPILEDIHIQGYDLTYFEDDTIGVVSGSYIQKYKLRHDFIYVDKENKRIYFREKDPRINITQN
jgi:hypothetical protein